MSEPAEMLRILSKDIWLVNGGPEFEPRWSNIWDQAWQSGGPINLPVKHWDKFSSVGTSQGASTSSIRIRTSLPLPLSCSLLERMQSTRFSSSLQDMVWMLLGRDSSSMFLAKSWTARERSLRGRC